MLPPQPFGQLPRWGAKRIRRFSSSHKHLASPLRGTYRRQYVQANWIFRSEATLKSSETPFRAQRDGGILAVIEQCGIYRSAAPSPLRGTPPMGNQEDSAISYAFTLASTRTVSTASRPLVTFAARRCLLHRCPSWCGCLWQAACPSPRGRGGRRS